jgi:aminopeptidase YwaD
MNLGKDLVHPVATALFFDRDVPLGQDGQVHRDRCDAHQRGIVSGSKLLMQPLDLMGDLRRVDHLWLSKNGGGLLQPGKGFRADFDADGVGSFGADPVIVDPVFGHNQDTAFEAFEGCVAVTFDKPALDHACEMGEGVSMGGNRQIRLEAVLYEGETQDLATADRLAKKLAKAKERRRFHCLTSLRTRPGVGFRARLPPAGELSLENIVHSFNGPSSPDAGVFLPMLTTIAASLALGFAPVTISPNTVRTHLEFLCSDELAGRMTLSKGMHLFANYAAAEFKKYGLQEGPNKGYFHYFDSRANQRATTKNVLTFESPEGKRWSLEQGSDFVPLVGSVNLKTVSGDVVYLGYGMDDGDWNDFAGVDLTGKVALMLRGVPEGRRNRTNGAKARTAVEKGAIGVIFAGPSGPGRAPLPALTRGQGVPSSTETVAAAINSESFEQVTGMKMAAARDAKAPASKLLSLKARLITETEDNVGKAINIIGYLPGNDPVLKDEYIVIGAHYDHLGYAEAGSRTGVDMIHYGADDNGSGSAGVLAVAEYMARTKSNKRTIIFQLYCAEELGLQGSNAWCRDNADLLPKITGMLNMDMIGTVRFNDIYVFGTSTSAAWEGLIDQVKVSDLNLVQRFHLRGDSDQASFGRRNVPALFFHSMLTDEYHTEKDTIDRVNITGAAKVCEAVATLAMVMDKAPKLAWNASARLGGRNDDRAIPTGAGKSERAGG